MSGDCVFFEGDYRFRVCTVSEYGRSFYVVFYGFVYFGEFVLLYLFCR